MKIRKNQLLFICVMFFWFAQYVHIPYQTPYLTSIQVSADFIGIIVGAYGISQMLFRLPVGVMADSKNRHKLFVILGGASTAAASVFRVVVGGSTGFFIANLFSGLASALWISFMVFYTSFFPEDQQQKATSQIIFANNLGVLGGFVTSTLLYRVVGMNVICVLGVVSGLICALLALGLPKGEEKHCDYTTKQLLAVCGEKSLIVFAVLALVQQGVQQATTMSFTTQVIKDMGASTTMVGIFSIVYMLSSVFFAKFSSTDLCLRLTTRRWIPIVFGTTALYCFLVPRMPNYWCILPLQVMAGMTSGILYTYLTGEAMRGIPAEKKSTALGFFQAVYALGMTILPMVSGKIADSFDMKSAYLFLSVLCVVAGISAIGYMRKKNA